MTGVPRLPAAAALAATLALVFGGCPGPPPPRTETARVEIDPARLLHQVSPLLFGMHIEWVEDGNGLLDPVRPVLRTEVIDRLRPLRVPLFRFPGGIHADYYDWRLGVDPPQKRRASRNVFTREQERHRFGTPEFLALLEATGAQALITANYGTGTPEEAGAWAEVLAASGPAPFWEVGNEIYLSSPSPQADGPNGRAIYHPPEEYARDFPSYRAAIRAAIPDALVGAIAHVDTGAFPLAPAENRDWTERMLEAIEEPADFIAVHNAYAPVILDDATDFSNERHERDAYLALYAAALGIRDNLDEVARTVARLSPIHGEVPIAVTELGPFFGLSAKPGHHAAYVDQTRTLAAALYTASVLDVLIGDPRVFMGCYTNPVHRWYGSLITDHGTSLVTTPTYHLYALYRSRFESRLVAAEVSSPSFETRRVGIVEARSAVPDLIARASIGEDGRRLTAMLVNRSPDRSLITTVALGGFVPATVDCLILTADQPDAISGPGLTASTRSGGEIVPRPFLCPAASSMELVIPPNAILSLVAEQEKERQRV
ncbi:MAG: hypothetical protein GY856_12325 [bacterium]|nr:hypothetical protein [bacterium]